MTTAAIQLDRRDWAAEQTVAWLPYIARVVGGMRIPIPVEDLIQEAATRVFLGLQYRYDESKASLKTWVYQEAFYAAKDAARHGRFISGNGRRKTTETIESLDRITAYDDSARPKAAAAAFIEDRPHVRLDMDFWRQQLKGCNKRLRIAVLSYYVLGEKQAAIADQLGVVESRVSQMLNAFKEERISAWLGKEGQ